MSCQAGQGKSQSVIAKMLAVQTAVYKLSGRKKCSTKNGCISNMDAWMTATFSGKKGLARPWGESHKACTVVGVSVSRVTTDRWTMTLHS